VLDAIAHRPLVVFTTAYDRYAVAAFEVEALDYLVKPFGRRRFRETVERVRRAFDAGAALPEGTVPGEGVAGAARETPVGRPLRRLFVRCGRRITPLAVADVVRFEAEGDYVRAHLAGRSHLLHVALKELETLLEPGRFLRVHRSHLVQLDRVASLEESDDRRFQVVLDDGSRVVASRAGSRGLKRLIR
jgi:two-component system LytT family response regulator